MTIGQIIELALEGEKQDKRFDGLILKWKQIRYSAYKELALKDDQRNLAKELLFQGKFEYYKELKELAKDKISFYYNFKQELKEKGRLAFQKYVSSDNIGGKGFK